MKAAFEYWPWRTKTGSTRNDHLNTSASSKTDTVLPCNNNNRNENYGEQKDTTISFGPHSNQQYRRMPTFLRLNSVGEVANHSCNWQQLRKRPSTAGKSGLCFSLSADSISSPKTGFKNQPLSTMASVKNISPRHCNNTTCHAFAADFTTWPHSPPNRPKGKIVPNCHSDGNPVWNPFTLVGAEFSIFPFRSRPNSTPKSIPECKMNGFSERPQTAMANGVLNSDCNKPEGGGPANLDTTCKTSLSIPEVVMCTKPVSSEEENLNLSTMPSQLPQQPACAIPAQPLQYSVSGGREDIPCVNNVAHPETPVACSHKHNCDLEKHESEMATSFLPTSAPNCNLKPGYENSSVATSSHIMSVSSTSGMDYVSDEGTSHLHCGDTVDKQVKTSDSGHSNSKKEKGCRLDVSSNCLLKHMADLSSVLYSPRKTARKGRPSSKKQKKRQRQKHKQIIESSHVDASPHCSPLFQKKEDLSQTVDTDYSDTSDIVFKSPDNYHNSVPDESIAPGTNHPKVSTPIKPQSKHPALACILYAEDSDLEESNGSHEEDESSDWSSDECESEHISTSLIRGFNVALNLDSIFKQQNIPTLESVLKSEENDSDSEPSKNPSARTANGLCLTVSVSLSEDSSEDSVRFDLSPFSPSTSSDLFGFNTGLCIENLLTKKAQPNNETIDICSGPAANHADDHAHSFNESSLARIEKIKEINAKWDIIYPTAGFRSCDSASGTIDDPNIKVQFAEEPMLKTVHEIGTEERGGTWRIDRQRFEARIKEAGEILSPILESAHRTKILQRNQRLEKEL